MTNLSQESYEDFISHYNDRGYPSECLVKLVDRCVQNPSFLHFMFHQQIWMRDRRTIMERLYGREVSEGEAFEDYQREFSDNNYLSYFVKYIAPVFCDERRESEFIMFPETDRQWVDSVFDKVAGIASIDKKTILSKIAEKQEELARKLEEEGFVGHFIPEESILVGCCSNGEEFADSDGFFRSDYY